MIQGGLGPDVWEREAELSAVDFMDATRQAVFKADELGGRVVSLEQNDYPEPKHPATACCGYRAPMALPYPVFWNEMNKVIQCHSCGHQFEPAVRKPL